MLPILLPYILYIHICIVNKQQQKQKKEEEKFLKNTKKLFLYNLNNHHDN